MRSTRVETAHHSVVLAAGLMAFAVQGILGGLAQLSVSRAMSMADASVLAPIELLRLPLVVVLAWFLFREPSDVWTLVGGTIVFGSTLAVVVFERHVRAAKRQAVPPTRDVVCNRRWEYVD